MRPPISPAQVGPKNAATNARRAGVPNTELGPTSVVGPLPDTTVPVRAPRPMTHGSTPPGQARGAS